MTAAPSTNSVESIYFRGMTDEQIREGVELKGESIIKRVFPGTEVEAETLAQALEQSGADFQVGLRASGFAASEQGFDDPDSEIIEGLKKFAASVRLDTMTQIGAVGSTFGVVQTDDAMQAAAILIERGEAKPVSVEIVDGGAKVRLAVLLGVSKFDSIDGAPNTLGHFALFEATHDGSRSTSCCVFTLRIECLNGITSREICGVHKLSHRSKAADRAGDFAQEILSELIGDIEAETAIFTDLARRRMTREAFETFSHEWLGGDLADDASLRTKNRRDREREELLAYWEGGNQGAGETLWGAYQSATRFLEAQRERLEDATRAAKKFESNLEGDGQRKVSRALNLLRRW